MDATPILASQTPVAGLSNRPRAWPVCAAPGDGETRPVVLEPGEAWRAARFRVVIGDEQIATVVRVPPEDPDSLLERSQHIAQCREHHHIGGYLGWVPLGGSQDVSLAE